MTTWALIPVKSFAHAKSRLVHLSSAQRAALACRLFEHVIAQVEQCAAIAGALVLTNGDDVERAALARGAKVLRDQLRTRTSAPGHLGRVIDAGLAHLGARGIRAAVVLMADLPQLTPADIDGMLALLPTCDIVIAPDRRSEGTNALALELERDFPTCFGHPDSLARHLARAETMSLCARVYTSASLARDIDVPADMTGIDATRPGGLDG